MSDLQTIALYVLISCFSLVLCRWSERNGNPGGLIAAAIALSCLCGFRDYSVGIDTSRYQIGVNYFFENNEVYWQYSFSYGYGIFSSAILHAWNNYSFLLFVQSLITNLLFLARFWDCRKDASLTFMLFVYLCTCYFHTFNIMCQFLAVAIVFYSTRYLDRGLYIPFVLGVLIAACIHPSAIVSLVMIVPHIVQFRGVTTGKKALRVTGLLILFVCLIFGYRTLIEKYGGYLGNADGVSLGAMSFVQVIILLISLFVSGYFSESNGSIFRSSVDKGFKYELLYYLLYLICAMASYIVDPAGRISYYFLPYAAPVYGVIANKSRISKNCFFVSVCLVVWFSFYAAYSFFLYDGGGIVPYSIAW